MNRETNPQENEEKVAVILDVRKLVQRCVELESGLSALRKNYAEQEQQLAHLRTQEPYRQGLLTLGEQELQRWKQEIRTCLRAIAHHTGDYSRLHSLESRLQSPELHPEEVSRWHQKLQEEFRMLYPTSPISISGESGVSNAPDWSAFRIVKK